MLISFILACWGQEEHQEVFIISAPRLRGSRWRTFHGSREEPQHELEREAPAIEAGHVEARRLVQAVQLNHQHKTKIFPRCVCRYEFLSENYFSITIKRINFRSLKNILSALLDSRSWWYVNLEKVIGMLAGVEDDQTLCSLLVHDSMTALSTSDRIARLHFVLVVAL